MSHHNNKKHCKKDCPKRCPPKCEPKCEKKCTRYCEWSNSCEDPCPVTTEKKQTVITVYRSRQNKNCVAQWGHTEQIDGCWEPAHCQPGKYQKKEKCHKKH